MINDRIDLRPEVYLYWDQLCTHLDNDMEQIFNGELVYPKQLEVHLPANHSRACQLACDYCAGKYFKKDLDSWEMDAYYLLDQLKGKIPQIVLGGAYTEPTMNPWLISIMTITRKHGASFGIHTNGVNLKSLEESVGFLTEANRIAESDRKSYISVSLDGGNAWNWGKVKHAKRKEWYWDVIDSLKMMVDIRDKNNGEGHAIRVGYLIQDHTGSEEELLTFVQLAKSIGVDSVRFSIPFYHYNKSFDEIKKYKEEVEIPKEKEYLKILEPYMSKSKDDQPYLFWSSPYFTDISRFSKIKQCIYSYFQLTISADGYYYPCSTTATETAKHLRLGKIEPSLDHFNEMVLKSQNPNFNPQEMCFDRGLRGNRMALECNCAYEELIQDGTIKRK